MFFLEVMECISWVLKTALRIIPIIRRNYYKAPKGKEIKETVAA